MRSQTRMCAQMCVFYAPKLVCSLIRKRRRKNGPLQVLLQHNSIIHNHLHHPPWPGISSTFNTGCCAPPLIWQEISSTRDDLVIELPCPSRCLSVCAIWCSFFQGLSLDLRAHDQFQAAHWSSPPLFFLDRKKEREKK